MAEQGKYKATMFLTIWQANFIGIVFGSWMFTSAKDAGPITSALMFSVWFGSMHFIWTRARRVFWPEDFDRRVE